MSRTVPLALLTGATGFLGAALAANLLDRGFDVRCAVRGDRPQERESRVRAAVEAAGAVAGGDRLEVVQADLERERLGLSAQGFADLRDGVTHVVHCGARVNMTLPYSALQAPNVRAVADLLDLAQACGAGFAFVGSLAAVAPSTSGEPFELIDPVLGGYGQSKWAADRLVCEAHRDGRVRALMLRAGRITADSRTARANPDDLLEQVLRVCVRLGSAPALETGVRISPVDWVAGVMTALCADEGAYGRAYHLLSAEALPWARALEAVREAGFPLAVLPYPQWRDAVLAEGRVDAAVARVAQALPAHALSFDERSTRGPVNARRRLGAGFVEPPVAAEQLAATLRAWRESGRLHAVG
ncbi:SDR family oxidoreductase [Actinospica robiniae]|uniref:SDR family oxidoreductase n=1 Tax=Actinospica robiniae TaxID=304901 RepID=UPI00041E1999|nr:SDR family oxidoreductase [Actinospica robiniae]